MNYCATGIETLKRFLANLEFFLLFRNSSIARYTASTTYCKSLYSFRHPKVLENYHYLSTANTFSPDQNCAS